MKQLVPLRALPVLLALLISFSWVSAQESTDRMGRLTQRLDSLGEFIPGLKERTTLSLREVPLHEYVRAIGMEHHVNLYIEDRPGLFMTSTLINEPVQSVFLFVCQHFHYDIQVIGRILHFFPYDPSEEGLTPLGIVFSNGLLSLDLQNDSLYRVIREVSRISGQKIITSPGTDRPVTVFVPPVEVDLALQLLADANDFHLQQNRKGYYIFRSQGPASAKVTGGRNRFFVEAFTDAEQPFLSIEAEEAELLALTRELFARSEADYFLFGELKGMVSISLEAAPLEEVLRYLFQGTDYTCREQEGIFLIGKKNLEGLRTVEIVKLKHRPTYQALELIPQGEGRDAAPLPGFATASPPVTTEPQGRFPPRNSARKQIGEVELIEYPELNRIILKGPTDRVQELAAFLHEIDEPIPMVKIEMIVVEISNSMQVSTGLKMGLGSPDTAIKQVMPGLNYTLNGNELNAALGASGVPFLQSIGTLSSSFYLQLQAEEERGNLEIRMCPVLSMLNGREASLTIGQTQYYLLKTTNASTGAGNSFQQFTEQFTQIEANVTLSIRPFVSEDNLVTLDLAPDFSTPIGSFDPKVPPAIATRKFESSIRVKNGETFILGGLTREEQSRSSKGLPLLSRLPILRWFFGSNTRQRANSSLLIYITPTIYYD